MAVCSICGDQTELFVNGTPLCLLCSDGSRESILRRLEAAENAAFEQSQYVTRAFNEIVSDVPSGLPHPDGVEGVERARREVKHAQEKYLEASRRLTAFLRSSSGSAR